MLLHRLRLSARKLGIELMRADVLSIDAWRLKHYLELMSVDLVLDVGANEGQFASNLREAGYDGDIVSFEPLPDVHARLQRAARGDSRWKIAPAMALSDREGSANFHVAGNSVSSSLLQMEELHSRAAPGSRQVAQIEVTTRRLDIVMDALGCRGNRPFLKIDVQGSESMILAGARGVLDRIIGIELELSLAKLYADQKLMPDLIAWAEAEGFQCWDIVPGFRDVRTARLLQSDGIFFRADAVPKA